MTKAVTKIFLHLAPGEPKDLFRTNDALSDPTKTGPTASEAYSGAMYISFSFSQRHPYLGDTTADPGEYRARIDRI